MMCYHAIFLGRVQGVGFRYTACSFADEKGIVGWVKNLPDGSVEMTAEADEESLDDLVSRLQNYFGANIRSVALTKSPASGRYNNFSVVF